MEFRGSPQTVRNVNTDNIPSNNIEEIGTTGRVPDSIYRGGRGDNQFLVGPRDATRPEGAASYSFDPKVSSTTSPLFQSNKENTYSKTITKYGDKGNIARKSPVVILQEQQSPQSPQSSQPNVAMTLNKESPAPPILLSGVNSMYVQLATLQAAYT